MYELLCSNELFNTIFLSENNNDVWKEKKKEKVSTLDAHNSKKLYDNYWIASNIYYLLKTILLQKKFNNNL
jgi:hypothetical protein